MSRSFLALLHFDGTEFLGWQRQATGRTVQGEVERVLARLADRHVAAHGAGRTDAGVHALGLAVSFAMPESWTPDALRRALNALLPRDIWVAALSEMRAGFHAELDSLREAATEGRAPGRLVGKPSDLLSRCRLDLRRAALLHSQVDELRLELDRDLG